MWKQTLQQLNTFILLGTVMEMQLSEKDKDKGSLRNLRNPNPHRQQKDFTEGEETFFPLTEESVPGLCE